MRVVKMVTLSAGPTGVRQIGELCPVTSKERDELIKAGAAVDPTDAELSKYRAPAAASAEAEDAADDTEFDDNAEDFETATDPAADKRETAVKPKAKAKPKAEAKPKAKAKDKGGKSPAAAAADALNADDG